MHELQWLSAEEGKAMEDMTKSVSVKITFLCTVVSLKNSQWGRMISELSLPNRVANRVLKLSEKVYFTE